MSKALIKYSLRFVCSEILQFIDLDMNFWYSIKPRSKTIGLKEKRIRKSLPMGWTDIVAEAIHTTCQIVFMNHFVSKQDDITINAACGVETCPVKFKIFIKHPIDNSKVTMTIETCGLSSHVARVERPLTGEKRNSW